MIREQVFAGMQDAMVWKAKPMAGFWQDMLKLLLSDLASACCMEDLFSHIAT